MRYSLAAVSTPATGRHFVLRRTTSARWEGPEATGQDQHLRCDSSYPRMRPVVSVADYLLLGIRWLHTMSAVAWVGGGLFYLLVLRPAMRRAGGIERPMAAAVGPEFRSLVNVAMAVLIITGAVLTFDRLTSTFVGAAYAGVLAAKVALAFYAFYLVRFLRRSSYPEEPEGGGHWPRRLATLCTGTTAILVLGVIVFLLSELLVELFQEGLRTRTGG